MFTWHSSRPTHLRTRSSQEPLPAREALRLDLVAAASELAVVCELAANELARIAERKPAQELLRACGDHQSAAMQLLAPETDFAAVPDAELRATLASFQDRLMQARGVRQHVEELVTSSRNPKAMRSVTWWPGEPDAGPSILSPQGWWPRRLRDEMNPVTGHGEAAPVSRSGQSAGAG